MQDVLENSRLAQPSTSEEVLPRHVRGGFLVPPVDSYFLVTKLKIFVVTALVSKLLKCSYKRIDSSIAGDSWWPIQANWRFIIFVWPPDVVGSASCPRNALVRAVKRTFDFPSKIAQSRKGAENGAAGYQCWAVFWLHVPICGPAPSPTQPKP